MNKSTKIIIAVCIALVVVLGIYVGINTFNNDGTKEILNNTVSKELTIEDFKEKLSQNGIIIEETTQKAGSLIGALEGYGYQINNEVIEVYKFDTKSNNELTVENIKMAKKEGKVKMPDFNNVEFKAIYNKGLVLINYEGHPTESKIVEIFKGL